jgi:hypothetical protein
MVQVDLRTVAGRFAALEQEAALACGLRPSAARTRAMATLVKVAHELGTAEALAEFARRLDELESENETEAR